MLRALVGTSAARQVSQPAVVRVFNENFAVYGVHKVWRQMTREGFFVAGCTVERMMRDMGSAGVIRGKAVRTTHSKMEDFVRFTMSIDRFMRRRPMLWVLDFIYVSTWADFVYVRA